MKRKLSIPTEVGWKPLLLFFTLAIILPPVTLFSAAGRLDWPMGGAFITVQVASGVISRLILFRTNPDLLTERARSLKAPNAKPWDRKMVVMVGPVIAWSRGSGDAVFFLRPAYNHPLDRFPPTNVQLSTQPLTNRNILVRRPTGHFPE